MKHLPVKVITKSGRKIEGWERVRGLDRAALGRMRGRGVAVNCETWTREVAFLLNTKAENR